MINNIVSKLFLKYIIFVITYFITFIFILIVSSPLSITLSYLVTYILGSGYEVLSSLILLLIIFSMQAYIVYKHSRQSLDNIIQEITPDGYKIGEINLSRKNNNPDNERIRKIFLKAKIKLKLAKDKHIRLVRVCGYEQFNAFAISNLAGENVVVIYDGLLHLQNREIQVIIGHEFGHIINKDSIMKTVQFSTLNTVAYMSNVSVAILNIWIKIGNIHPLISLFVIPFVLSFKILNFIVHAVMPYLEYITQIGNRQAEYIADFYGAKSTSVENAINTFEIMKSLETTDDIPLYLRLLNEHPPTSKRIAFLKSLK